MANKPKDNTATRSAREQPTGLARFAVPEADTQPHARTAGSTKSNTTRKGASTGRKKSSGSKRSSSQQQSRQKSAKTSGSSRPSSQTARKQTASRTKGNAAGMQMRVSGTQHLTPQKQGATRRPLAAGRTGRARSLHLQKIVKRKERRARLSKIIAIVLSLVCGVFALTTFFRVDAVEIQGLSRYPADEVRTTFGVQQGDNLFFCDSARGKNRLLKQYPYFESVSVERDLPNRMILKITESKPIAAVNGTQGGWFILDKNCRVLARTDQSGAQDTAEVMGVRTAGAEPGQQLTAEQPEALEALKELANALDTVGLGGKATLYNLEDLNSIWFLYEDRFAVCVGDTSELEHKLAILYELLTGDQFTPSDKGTINLSLGDRAITNTSLSEGEVERTARGQAELQHIDQPEQDSTDEEKDGQEQSDEDDETT